MQKEFLSDGYDQRKGPRPTNFDFSLSRCKTEKLLEQMTVEKAITVLKVRKIASLRNLAPLNLAVD